MTFFVTGATDTVGVNLVHVLLQAGRSVRVLLRNNDRYNVVLRDLPVEVVYGDIRDANTLRRAMKNVTAVFHTEELNPLEYCPPQAYFAVNTLGTRNVLQVAVEKGIPRVVYTSSAFTIGGGTLDRPADETWEFNLEDLKDPYIESKRKAEALVREFREKGLEVVILNPGVVVGPRSLRSSVGTGLVRLSSTLTKIYPTGGSLIADAEDVARAHLLAMEKGFSGERYILGAENMKYLLLLDLLYTILGFRPFTFSVPRFSAMMMGWLADALARLLGKPIPGMPSLSVIRRSYVDLFLSSEKATLHLGMTWTPMNETLRKTVQWLRENEML